MKRPRADQAWTPSYLRREERRANQTAEAKFDYKPSEVLPQLVRLGHLSADEAKDLIPTAITAPAYLKEKMLPVWQRHLQGLSALLAPQGRVHTDQAAEAQISRLLAAAKSEKWQSALSDTMQAVPTLSAIDAAHRVALTAGYQGAAHEAFRAFLLSAHLTRLASAVSPQSTGEPKVINFVKPSGNGPMTLRDVSPELAQAEDKLADLKASLERAQAQERRIGEQIEREAPRVAMPVVNRGPSNDPDVQEEERKLRELLGPAFKPEDLDGPATANGTDAKQHPLYAELLAVNVEIGRLHRAIQLISPHVDRLRRKAAPELCRQRGPEYRALAQRYCDALLELGNVQKAHERFIRSLGGDYVNYAYLGPVEMLASANSPNDLTAELRRLLGWAAECGHFDLARMPADWSAHQ